MAEEIIYADINILEDSSPTLQHQDLQGSAHWHRCFLRLALAGNVILAVMVIALGIQVFQVHPPQTDIKTTSAVPENGTAAQRNSPGRECNTSLVELVSLLKWNLCLSARNTSADSAGCKLCPMYWLSHRGKCYWFSKENVIWNKSHDDCLAKGSRMLVIQDREEMDFIYNFTHGKYPVWLGLRFLSPENKWTWVDSSGLDPTLFQFSAPVDVNSCGMIKGNQITPETCSAVFKWICKKEAMIL